MRIERDSVNSVALDSEPHDQHDRMLVAGFVGMNPTGNTMMVRDTTMLPNYHGLPALLGLLFAPNAELRLVTGIFEQQSRTWWPLTWKSCAI